MTEIVDDYDGDTYRAVYTVRFAGVVYLLHAFQKKSKNKSHAEAGRRSDRKPVQIARDHYQRTYVSKQASN